jgi:hypothetical protein
MNYYKIKYQSGDFKIVKAKTALEVVKKYDLATRENIETRLIQLEGEQLAIAIANDRDIISGIDFANIFPIPFTK